jgi:tRNA nucleotidyltransferase (CCA-adding enzyme)
VPVECRDAARLLAHWHDDVDRIDRMMPAAIVDLLQAADVLRRPERLETLLASSEAIARSVSRATKSYEPADTMREALRVVSRVDAGAIARNVKADRGQRVGRDGGIARAVRAARIAALRQWKRTRARSP